MSHRAIRAAIKARMETVPGIGQVQEYERFASANPDLAAFYMEDGRLNGWYIRRLEVQREPDGSLTKETTLWRLVGLRSFEDTEASELTFDDLIDGLIAAFAADETLSDTVETTRLSDADGLELQESGPVMFAGILAHEGRLELKTFCYRDAPLALPPLDDFKTFHADWDVPPHGNVTAPLPAGDPDAEDTIDLENP
jgi:hypothetical protein